MGYGRSSTPARARYGERMTPKLSPVPEPIVVIGPDVLMAVACQKCRKAMFSRSPEQAVTAAIEHAQECGTNKVVVAELVTAAGAAGV